MASCQKAARPIYRSLHQAQISRPSIAAARLISTSTPRCDEVTTTSSSAGSNAQLNELEKAAILGENKSRAIDRLMDPNTTTAPWAERRLMRAGKAPVGSRRRRAAVRSSQNLPFEQLPYQCFQEARKVLQEDRQEKIDAIVKELAKIKMIEESPIENVIGGEARRQLRLTSLRNEVERLKIMADINDPTVKKRFEDGLGDMDKPIYRHLAQKKWMGLPYRIITQRISQFNIVPDVLPKFEPSMEVKLYFRSQMVQPGDTVNSLVSEVPPRLKVQVFDAGERLVSVVVMDSDVPNVETDSFDRRCHYLAANIPISPNEHSIAFGKLDKETQVAVPWLPAWSQKGAPYHRLSVFVLEQKPGEKLDVAKLRELYTGRDGFSLKSFRDKFPVTPVGFNLFRTVWDENTAGVMERLGVPGADVEFKLNRVYSLKPERKARGWEAKRQGPKYKSLWKYTKRIKGM